LGSDDYRVLSKCGKASEYKHQANEEAFQSAVHGRAPNKQQW